VFALLFVGGIVKGWARFMNLQGVFKIMWVAVYGIFYLKIY
jgi:hypothetical protein